MTLSGAILVALVILFILSGCQGDTAVSVQADIPPPAIGLDADAVLTTNPNCVFRCYSQIEVIDGKGQSGTLTGAPAAIEVSNARTQEQP